MNAASTVTLNDGRKIPVLGLGVSRVPKGKTAEQVVTWALEVGYRHIDTAWLYRNEASVGKAIRNYPIDRRRVWVTTKIYPNQFLNPRKAIEDSLRKLDVGYIDLYLVHWPPPVRSKSFDKKLWRAMESFRDEGLCKSIGVSNYLPDRLASLLSFANTPPAVNQVLFSPLHFHKSLYEFCTKAGIQIVGYRPLGRGEGVTNQVIKQVAEKNNKTPAQIMLRWAVQKGVIPIPKSVNHDRIVTNSQIFNFSLSDADMQRLDDLSTA